MTKQEITISGKRILLIGSTGVLGRVYAAELAKIDNVQLINIFQAKPLTITATV